jgi:hypothetical protein
MGDAEFFGGFGETDVPCRGFECANCIQWREFPHHGHPIVGTGVLRVE